MIDKAIQRITTDLARIEAKVDKLLKEQPMPATELFEKPKPMPIVDEYEEFVKRGDYWVSARQLAECTGATQSNFTTILRYKKVPFAQVGSRCLFLASKVFKAIRPIHAKAYGANCQNWKDTPPDHYMSRKEASQYTGLADQTLINRGITTNHGATREAIDRFLLSKLVRPE